MEKTREIINFINSIQEDSLAYSLFIILFLIGMFILIIVVGVWLNNQVNINNSTSVVTKDQERRI